MKTEIKTLSLIMLFLSANISANEQGKYLGKKAAADLHSQTNTVKKVNLLDDEFIKKNEHLSNPQFWNETNSSKVVNTEARKVPLSDELFSTIKKYTEVSKRKPEKSLLLISSRKPHSETTRPENNLSKKAVLPPKKSLIGHDHHHNYANIEASYSGSYDPLLKKVNTSSLKLEIKKEHDGWTLGPNEVTLLSSTLRIKSDEVVSYYDHLNELSLIMAKEYFETFEVVDANSVTIKELNKNDEEFLSGKYLSVLRDVCVQDNLSEQSILIRYRISTITYNIGEAIVYAGMKCEA